MKGYKVCCCVTIAYAIKLHCLKRICAQKSELSTLFQFKELSFYSAVGFTVNQTVFFTQIPFSLPNSLFFISFNLHGDFPLTFAYLPSLQTFLYSFQFFFFASASSMFLTTSLVIFSLRTIEKNAKTTINSNLLIDWIAFIEIPDCLLRFVQNGIKSNPSWINS